MMDLFQYAEAKQLPLMPSLARPEYEPEMSIQDRFEAFHAANPHICIMLEEMALQMREWGIRKSGIKFLVEKLRWDYMVQTRGEEPFKISNDFTSRYARLLMDRNPALVGFFDTKELRSE